MLPLPKHFFSLKDFSHPSLFFQDKPVWETLKHIKPYLTSYKLGNIECTVPNETILINPNSISIGEGTKLEAGACIEGPCIIGKHTTIRHGAYLRPHLIIGDHCTVGHSVELKHTVLLNHSCVSHFNYVGDSLIGNDVNLGAGVICANLRLDRKEVIIRLRDKSIKSGFLKFGSVIGDGSQIGCNCVINPGVLIKKKTLSKACFSWQTSNWTEPVGV